MSSRSFLNPRRLFFVVLVLTGLFCASAMAGADDLSQFKARNEITVQKLVSDVNAALNQARTIEKSDPVRARDMLRRVAGQLEDDILLPERQRSALYQQVKSRLQNVNQLVREKQLLDDQTRLQVVEKQRQELRQLEEKIARDKGPSSIAKNRVISVNEQMKAWDKLRNDRAIQSAGVFSSIVRSATPIAGDIEFPSYWKQLTETRKKFAGPKMSPKEVAILKALNSTMPVDFKDRPFNGVIDYLNEKIQSAFPDAAIIVDQASLRDKGIDDSTLINFKVHKVTVRTILRKVLGDLGLAYIIKDGTIQVVTAEKARDTMIVRTYPIDDLVGADPNFGPFVARWMLYQNVQNLINSIQTGIEPSHWQVNGGPGSITFYEPGLSLIIRSSAEMHYMFGSGSLAGR